MAKRWLCSHWRLLLVSFVFGFVMMGLWIGFVDSFVLGGSVTVAPSRPLYKMLIGGAIGTVLVPAFWLRERK